jgi:hypothetical protein
MTRNILPLLFLFACGDTPAVDDDGGSDATTNKDSASNTDSGSKDGAAADTGADAADTGTTDDGAADTGIDAADGGPLMGCQNANDCKLFSSYCSTDPCKCIPLEKKQPNPVCNGMKVTCFVDPCLNKSAFCNNGTCDVQ